MAVVGYGTKSKLAVVKGSTWGTAVTLTTNHRVPFVSEALKARIDQVTDDTINGKSIPNPEVQGNELVEGTIEHLLDYRQHGLLLAAFIGEDGTPGAGGDAGTYIHEMTYSHAPDGIFICAGADRVSEVTGYNSLKPTGMTLDAAAGGIARVTHKYLGRGYDRSLASTAWTFANDPLNGGGRLALFSQLVVRANAQSGGALGSGDVFYPRSIKIECDRRLAANYVQSGQTDEPVADGWGDVKVTLEFFTTAAILTLFKAAQLAGTVLKADLVFTGTIIAGTTAYKYGLYLPKLKVVDYEEKIPGPGRIPVTIHMTAHDASSVPTGFPTGVKAPLVIQNTNEIATDYLA